MHIKKYEKLHSGVTALAHPTPHTLEWKTVEQNPEKENEVLLQPVGKLAPRDLL